MPPYYNRIKNGYGYNSSSYYNRPSFQNTNRYLPPATLTVSNIYFISGKPGEPNALIKNIISPSCSVVLKIGQDGFHLRFILINNERKTYSGKLDFEVPKESLESMVYTKLEEENQTAESVQRDGERTDEEKMAPSYKKIKVEPGIDGANENGGAQTNEIVKKDETVKKEHPNEVIDNKQKETEKKEEIDSSMQRKYTSRLVLCLCGKLKINSEDKEIIEKSDLNKTLLIIAEFKGKAFNKKSDPMTVLPAALSDGHLKGFANDKPWTPKGENVYAQTIDPFIQISRKEEQSLSEKVSCPLCGTAMQRRLLAKHARDMCPERSARCAHCSASLRSRELAHHIRDDCAEAELPCAFGCGENGKRAALSAHAKGCRRRPTACHYSAMGCGEPVPFEDLEQHLRQEAHVHLFLLERRMARAETRLAALEGEEKEKGS